MFMATFFFKKQSWVLGLFSAFLMVINSSLHADPVDIPDPINILNQQRLLGEFKGGRPQLETNGVVMTLQSISDLLGNVQGGQKEGGSYSGLLNLGLAVDLQKLSGWEGASFKNTWLWLYGNDVSKNFIGNAFTASTIAGAPAFRCYELWLQQNLFHDVVSLRGGLLPFDTEFMTSETANMFLNTAFGPMALITLNLPNGGPQYPEATPGLRMALQPTSWLTLRTAFMQANPFEQENNLHNFNWNFGSSGGFLNINEAAATWNKDATAKGLPGTAKVGCWFQTGQGPTGEESFSYGSPTAVASSSGFYGIVDQQLYTPSTKATGVCSGKNPVTSGKATVPGCDCSGKGLSSFLQMGFDPQPVSVSSFYASAGLVYTGLIPTRDADKLGVSFAYARMSDYLQNKASESGFPGASFEGVTELTYSIRLAPAVAIQPDLQYILHPGGTQQYGNALVVGARAVVDF
jgi:porin